MCELCVVELVCSGGTRHGVPSPALGELSSSHTATQLTWQLLQRWASAVERNPDLCSASLGQTSFVWGIRADAAALNTAFQ